MRRRWQTATGKLEANVLVEKKTIRSDRLPFHLGCLLPPTRGHPEALQATCVVDKGSSRKERKIEPRSFWVDTIRARRKKKGFAPPGSAANGRAGHRGVEKESSLFLSLLSVARRDTASPDNPSRGWCVAPAGALARLISSDLADESCSRPN